MIKCENGCDDTYLQLTTEMREFCWECTCCGWHKRIVREAYEEAVKRNREQFQGGGE